MSLDAQGLADQTYTEIGTLRDACNTALSDLTAVVSGSMLAWFDIAGITPPEISAPDAVTIGDLPTMATIDFTAVAPAVRDAFDPSTIPAFTAATMEAPDADISFDESLISEIQSQFNGILTSGGQNVASDVQAAVFDVGYERSLQIKNDALDLCGARTGSKGCRYPNSMTKAQQDQIVSEYGWQRSDLSRQITKAFADMAQSNLSSAMSAGASITAVRAELEAKIKTLGYESKRIAFDKFRLDTENNYNTWKGQLETMMASFQVDLKNYELTLDYQTAVREHMRLQATENIAEFDAANKNILTQLEADKIIQQLKQEYERTLIQKFQVDSNNVLERGKAQVQQVIEENRVRVGAMKALAESYIGIAQAMGVQAVSIVTKKT